MLLFQVSLDVLVILGLAMLPVIIAIGFLRRGYMISELKARLSEADKELLISYAEILDLQREKTLLEQKIQQSSIPVIPITSAKDDKLQEVVPDVSTRKKMLGAQALHQNL